MKAKEKAVEYKGGVCVECGCSFHPVCFDFHHIDPSVKEGNIANLLQSRSFENVLPELEKTVLVCRNCHMLLHFRLMEAV